jgi:hypothetical protein
MAQYRSARGKVVDMSALAARNERVRAVGNMNVNARGDTIDSQGNILVPATKKASDKYQNTVGNKSANKATTDEHRLVPDSLPPIVDPVLQQDEPVTELEEEFDSDFVKEEETEAEEKIVIKPASEAPQFFKPEPKAKK